MEKQNQQPLSENDWIQYISNTNTAPEKKKFSNTEYISNTDKVPTKQKLSDIKIMVGSVGNYMQILRKQEKLSQYELSEKTGIKESLIKQFENGQRLPQSESVYIAKALKIPYTEFRKLIIKEELLREYTFLQQSLSTTKEELIKLGITINDSALD